MKFANDSPQFSYVELTLISLIEIDESYFAGTVQLETLLNGLGERAIGK
ncbi:hypothetical protein MAL01_14590 [Leptospira noguchii]|nr:hypothetical protein [Leptospira noguchii]UOG33750.1 hypothetical protein MAL02_14315 [Leptospira noguchii]UOG44595.1 hypothetical protein MAL01_14590 [Leptospira noguchii]